MGYQSFYTAQQWQWVAERYREGYSIAELARFLDVHRETVRRQLMRLGEKPKPHTLIPLRERRREFPPSPPPEVSPVNQRLARITYRQAHYLEYRDKLNAYQRAYYEKHKDAINARKKAYREKQRKEREQHD